MQSVLMVDKNKEPLMPCHPARARKLLKNGRAAVLRQFPFTIMILDREGSYTQPVQFKVDPGAKTTGLALVASFKRGLRCIWAAELTHRGWQAYAKTHWLDAVCVGKSGEKVFVSNKMQALQITALGRGSRQMCRVDKFGFPRTKAKLFKRVQGFQTGDIVRAVVTAGKKIGIYLGRVDIRASGSFNIKTENGTIQGISHKYCQLVQRVDGYAYSFVSAVD